MKVSQNQEKIQIFNLQLYNKSGLYCQCFLVFMYVCVCVCLCMCVFLCVCFEKEIFKNFKCTSEHPGLSSTKQEDFLKTVGLKTFLKFSGKRTQRLQSLFVEICYRSLPKWLEHFYQIYSSFSRAPTEDKRSHQRCS